MAFSSDDLIKLESAISQGAVQVQFKDRLVKYHSLSEMIRLRDMIRAELGLNGTASNRIVNPTTGRGL